MLGFREFDLKCCVVGVSLLTSHCDHFEESQVALFHLWRSETLLEIINVIIAYIVFIKKDHALTTLDHGVTTQ